MSDRRYSRLLAVVLLCFVLLFNTTTKVYGSTESHPFNGGSDPSFLYDDDGSGINNGNSNTTRNGTEGNETTKACGWLTTCREDSDCGAGHCVGASNKCHCGACAPLTPCVSDEQCGGLRYACDETKKICDCSEGILRNGFKDLLTGIVELCGSMSCKLQDPESCFGLPCVPGICVCVPRASRDILGGNEN